MRGISFFFDIAVCFGITLCLWEAFPCVRAVISDEPLGDFAFALRDDLAFDPVLAIPRSKTLDSKSLPKNIVHKTPTVCGRFRAVALILRSGWTRKPSCNEYVTHSLCNTV